MKQEVKQAMLIPETSNVASNYVPPSVIKPVENPPVPVKVPIITPAEEEKKESVKISADIKETPKEEKSIIQNSQEKKTSVPIREPEKIPAREPEKITAREPKKQIIKEVEKITAREPEKIVPNKEKKFAVQLDPAVSQSIAAAVQPKIEDEVPINEDEACLVCLGKKVNAKGKKCKECKGTGRMNLALLSRIQKMVEKHCARRIGKAVSNIRQDQENRKFA